MLLLKPYGTAQYGRTPSSYVTFINTVATYVLPRKNIRRALWTSCILVVTSAAFMYRMQAGNGVGPGAK